MKNLQGKCVLVCGGATGIGAATVRRLCQEGARVGLGDINASGAQALADELNAGGGDVTVWGYDQADESSVNALVASAVEHFGRLDGLFANVANLQVIFDDGDLLSNDLDLWDNTLRVNLIGTVALVRAALPQMLQQGGGSILLTSSDAAAMGEPERPAYAASKAGLHAVCRHVASRWGKENIRCNVISPGFVLTEQIKANMPESMLNAMLKGARSPRHGQPEDIAGAVAFLLSEDGEWINGQVWRVNGGVSYAL